MFFTTRTKITLLFTLIVGVLLIVQNTILFESANREWQTKQTDYVSAVMKGMYTPDEAKTKFAHLKISDASGSVVHTQGVFASGGMLEKSASFLFREEGIYEKDGAYYFSVREEKGGKTLDMAEDITGVIHTRDMIVDRSLWVSLFGILAVILLGYGFSWYILRPIRHMGEVASGFSLEEKGKIHAISVKGHIRDEVVVLARSLESLFSRVKSEASKLEQFSDDMAHEIKNKLFSIESSLDVALHTEHREHGITKAKNMITELSSVVDALLFFSRSESGKGEMTDIGELVRSHIDLTDTRIEIIEKEKISRVVYPELFMTAIGNIVSNAEKFTPEDGKIDIIISSYSLEIRDTGVGIARENLSKVFDRLWKSDISRTHGSGHGLGLAIAKKIIEGLHGYTLSVESEVGRGTRFIVEWEK